MACFGWLSRLWLILMLYLARHAMRGIVARFRQVVVAAGVDYLER